MDVILESAEHFFIQLLNNLREKGQKPCMISGFHSAVTEFFDLLGCYPVQIHNYRPLRTTYWSYLQGSSSPRRMLGTLRYAVTQGMVWVVIGSQRT
jgi:hypothetical protein